MAGTLPGLDRFAYAYRHCRGVERLFYEIERAVADRIDCHRNVAAAGDRKDRGPVLPRIQRLQQFKTGAARKMHINENACRRTPVRSIEKGFAVGEACDFQALVA